MPLGQSTMSVVNLMLVHHALLRKNTASRMFNSSWSCIFIT